MTQELALTGGKSSIPLAFETLSKASMTALTKGDPGKDSSASMNAVADIIKSPDLHREIMAALPVLEAAAGPCGPAAVAKLLEPLLLLYPPKDMPAEEAAKRAYWKVIRSALEDIPYEALRWAVAEYIKTSTFKVWPAPGELRKLAAPKQQQLARAAYRAKLVAQHVPPKTVGEDERARVKAGLEELRRSMRGGGLQTMPKAQRPRETPQEMAARLKGQA